MKMLNALIFSFIILNLVKKGTLDFHVTTAIDTCMKEVIQALILTIIVLNLVSKGLFLLCYIITDPSISYGALRYSMDI